MTKVQGLCGAENAVTHPGSSYQGHTLATKAATLTLLFTTCVTPHYRTARVPPLNTHIKVFQESDGFSKIRQSGAGEEAVRKPGSGQPNVL